MPQSHRDTESERVRDGETEAQEYLRLPIPPSLCLSFSVPLYLCG
jgi:hypothetical protein